MNAQDQHVSAGVTGCEYAMRTRQLDLWYGIFQALYKVDLNIREGMITSLIGPSGCGKSTLLRSVNRINERLGYVRIEGSIEVLGQNIYDPEVELIQVRKQVGMVFQRPNPFPQSIFDNVAFGPRVLGLCPNRAALDERVRESLVAAGLWEEVAHRLHGHAEDLNPGQQQRLCIARTVATRPDIILMDEPCSALDPVATLRVEALMRELARDYTIVVVTHNMQQAARVSDWTGFFWLGELIEYSPTSELFVKPEQKLTEDYLTGRRG